MTDERIEEIIEIDGREYQGFEWYENKNESNIDEHKIDFMDAKELFSDDDFVNTTARTVKGEKRWKAIGFLQTDVITVVYTIRGKYVRIISARRANNNERKDYKSQGRR